MATLITFIASAELRAPRVAALAAADADAAARSRDDGLADHADAVALHGPGAVVAMALRAAGSLPASATAAVDHGEAHHGDGLGADPDPAPRRAKADHAAAIQQERDLAREFVERDMRTYEYIRAVLEEGGKCSSCDTPTQKPCLAAARVYCASHGERLCALHDKQFHERTVCCTERFTLVNFAAERDTVRGVVRKLKLDDFISPPSEALWPYPAHAIASHVLPAPFHVPLSQRCAAGACTSRFARAAARGCGRTVATRISWEL